ncbi:PREDICTED: condensin complex subunit 3-like isoform X2 [Nicrophorus vespilloides]|nr:PREDICTED: condensin complex subunit 3-like isoform X2 [Nicrophorus vespilloides]
MQAEYKNSNPEVERILQFVALFCEGVERKMSQDLESTIMESPFLSAIIQLLLMAQPNANHVIRYRACQLIQTILSQLKGFELSVEIFDTIQDAMLERLKDERESVRLQAVCAIFSLQDPSDPDCPVVNELSTQMMGDPSAKVRKLCLEKVGLRQDILENIIMKTRDVNVKVRLAAYTRCSLIPKAFKVIQRQKLIKYGFTDENESIRMYMHEHFVTSWFECYEEDYLMFINSLCLDSDFKDCKETSVVVEHVLSAFFASKPHLELKQALNLNENRLLPLEDLKFESVLYWRCYLEMLRKCDVDEDEYFPELVHLCKYIQNYYKDKNDLDPESVEYFHNQFILQQLFQITMKYDFGDKFLQETLNALVGEVLQNAVLEEEVVEAIMKNLDYTIPDVNEQIKFVCLLISEISYEVPEVPEPEENNTNKLELAKLKIELSCLKEDLDVAIKEQNFLKAEGLKDRITEVENVIINCEVAESGEVLQEYEKKTDLGTLRKCLDICNGLLSSLRITTLNSMLMTLKDNTIQVLLSHKDETVGYKAMKCYGLCCIMDQSTAEIGIHLFCVPIDSYSAGTVCNTDRLLLAISAVVDMIVLYGTDLIAKPTDPENSFDEQHETIFKGGSSLTTIIQGLVDLLQDENTDVQEHASHGLCNLLLASRIQSHAVISRLILKWCTPHSNDEQLQKMIQRIGLTLEKLPRIRDSADELENAVLPTVKAIIKAPKTSPLAGVNALNIANFLIQLCQTHPQRYHMNSNLMIRICSDMLKRPKSVNNLTYSKMLLMFPLDEIDSTLMRELLTICDDVRNEVLDKLVVRNVIKFIANITSLMNQIGSIQEESDEDKENIPVNNISPQQQTSLDNIESIEQ